MQKIVTLIPMLLLVVAALLFVFRGSVAREVYDGPVTVGRDGALISLPSGSDAIRVVHR